MVVHMEVLLKGRGRYEWGRGEVKCHCYLIICIGGKPHDPLDTDNAVTHTPLVLERITIIVTIVTVKGRYRDREIVGFSCTFHASCFSIDQTAQQHVQSTGVKGFVSSKHHRIRASTSTSTRARTRTRTRIRARSIQGDIPLGGL